MKYPKKEELQLIALDLDGTVICSKGESPLSERLQKVITELQTHGLPVTFVTGRTEDYALPLANKFGIELPMVTYNGARIFSVTDSKILYEASIDRTIAQRVCDWLQKENEVVACYLNRDGQLYLTQSRCSGRPSHDDYLYGPSRRIVESLASEIEADDKVSKLIVSTQRPLAKELYEKFGPITQVVRTHPELVEILPLGVSKGSGLKKLCQLLKIDPIRVLAIGDQENDISTFSLCGYSVAMGDAPENVKKAAQFLTEDFSDEGCARALERLL